MNYLSITKKIPLAMRVTLILLCLIAFQLQAEDVYSQKTKISLDMKNASVEKVLQTIEEKSDYYFLYNNKLVNVDRKVSMQVKNAAISDVLDKLFASQDVEYQVEGKQIILSPKEKAKEIVSLVEGVQQQQKTITGKVTDSSGEPLPGATVMVKGTTIGTITDADGNYSLSNVSNDATLVFSFVGMRTQEVLADNRTVINIRMEEETIGLEEVVAIGYGTQRKADVTSAISSVRADDFIKGNVKDIGQLIQGKVAGLTVVNPSGDPTQNTEVVLRGNTTLLGSSISPLVLIDGVPGDLKTIAPQDIESIDVLKDGSAAAIYGTRGTNGVILITTRRATGDYKSSLEINS